MNTKIELSNHIVSEAEIMSKVLNRSVSGQIEHWVKIGKLAEENPDLPYEFIKNILISREEVRAGKTEEYSFDEK